MVWTASKSEAGGRTATNLGQTRDKHSAWFLHTVMCEFSDNSFQSIKIICLCQCLLRIGNTLLRVSLQVYPAVFLIFVRICLLKQRNAWRVKGVGLEDPPRSLQSHLTGLQMNHYPNRLNSWHHIKPQSRNTCQDQLKRLLKVQSLWHKPSPSRWSSLLLLQFSPLLGFTPPATLLSKSRKKNSAPFSGEKLLLGAAKTSSEQRITL